MEAVRIETVMQPNGEVVLCGLPFEPGKPLEIIVLESEAKKGSPYVNPLKGSVLKYDDPFEPATSPEDWEALR